MTLLGAGQVTVAMLAEALTHAPILVAADGGAAFALAAGRVPVAVIGDMDSIDDSTKARIPPPRLHHLAEQETTDFDKCLREIAAPLVLGAGFLGGRLDHELAALNALVRHPGQRCILIGPEDICFNAPNELALDLPEGSRVSLFPLAAVRAGSEGLNWPVDSVQFDPAGAIGTSNRSIGPLRLRADRPGLIVILPSSCLEAAIRALAPGVAEAAEVR